MRGQLLQTEQGSFEVFKLKKGKRVRRRVTFLVAVYALGHKRGMFI